MINFFRKLTAGHLRKHRLEALLCVLGVALGVAVVVGIDSAVAACGRSCSGAVQSLAERSTHAVFSTSGSISDETYVALAQKRLPFPLALLLDRGVLVDRGNEEPVVARLIGVDVFSERSLRSFTRMQSTLDEAALHRYMTEPGAVVLVDALATRLGVSEGDAMRLTIGSRRVDARVTGIVKPEGVARSQLPDLIIADLATAQELTDALGTIDRIDTRLESDADAQALAATLPAGLSLRSTNQQSLSLADLIAAYRMNLNALSLMASFVAVFIVYNSMLVSVQQRVTSLGILRCLGASRVQLGGLYLAEAVVVAIVGGVLGVVLGWALARGLVGLVATTINDLYAAVRPGPVELNAAAFAKGLGLSIVSCLVGAIIPLYKASRTAPVNAFRGTERARASSAASVWLLAAGLLMLAAAYGAYRLPGESPVAGFAVALLVALGAALCCPWATSVAARLLGRVARLTQMLPLQMAASGVRRSLGITGVAVAATMLAMAMNVGVRTMVGSFRGALGNWLDRRFAADVFVGPELLVNHRIDAALDPGVAPWVRRQPGVRRVTELRTADVDHAGKPITLVATNVRDVLPTLPMKSGDVDPATFDPAGDVLISEPLAGRTDLGPGDTIELASPSGPRRLRVRGVYFDFGSERGQVMLERSTYAAAWRDDRVTSLHVRIDPGLDPDETAAKWSAGLRGDFPVVVNSFRHVRAEVLRIFDRTFKITEVLTWLAGGVAFCGLAGSLLALSLARQRDYSLLAAVGMSGRQTAAWVVGQGVVIAVVSAVVASAAGTLLAYVLAYVIQYRSFGWSIPASAQPRFWAENVALGVAAALVAAAYPILRLRRTPPAANLRQE